MTYAILADFSAAQLAAVHNLFADKPVRKFESAGRARDRVAIVLQRVGVAPEQALMQAGLLAAPDTAAAEEAAAVAAELDDAAAIAEIVHPHPAEMERRRALIAELRGELLADDPPARAPAITSFAEREADVLAPALYITLGELHATYFERKLGVSPADADWLADLVATKLNKLTRVARRADRAAPVRRERRGTEPTATQAALIACALQPGGASGRMLCGAAGWPSIAARRVLEDLGRRFGYAYGSHDHVSPKLHFLVPTNSD